MAAPSSRSDTAWAISGPVGFAGKHRIALAANIVSKGWTGQSIYIESQGGNGSISDHWLTVANGQARSVSVPTADVCSSVRIQPVDATH
jgi:hypothetical protein